MDLTNSYIEIPGQDNMKGINKKSKTLSHPTMNKFTISYKVKKRVKPPKTDFHKIQSEQS